MSGWRTNREIARFSRTLCVLCVAWVPFMAACAKRAAAPDTPVLRISQRNEPATLDPQLATLPDEFFIIRALSEGLVNPNPAGGVPLPGVATRWESTPDGLTWTFHLDPAARWSNGDPVTADDFVASIRRALTPATAAPKASLFFPIRNASAFYRGSLTDFSLVGVAAPDGRTLVIKLERAMADFLPLVASGPWIPVHSATVARLGSEWSKPGNFVGNGPFILTEWSPHQHLTVRRSPHFHRADAIKLGGIQFIIFDSGDTEERAFRAGQLDVTMAVPTTKLDGYRDQPASPLRIADLHETRYLALNTTRFPLNDVRVRRALSLSLDRESLTGKILKAGQHPAHSFIPPGLGGYRPGTVLTENADEARRLLAEAGFPGGKDFPKLELSTWGAGTAVLEAIQQRWHRELGINVTLLQREARTHLASLTDGSYDLGFVTAIPDYASPLDLLIRFTKNHAENYPHWHNPGFDALLDHPSPPAWIEAEALLLDQLPVIPLYYNARSYLVRPSVHGWREDALWTRYYHNVFLDAH
jgi:oligopeptide transport system substrate-binding protein